MEVMNPLYDSGSGQTIPFLLRSSATWDLSPSVLLFILTRFPSSPNCLSLSARSASPASLPVVMTPSSRIMLPWSNCPRMPASLRKERRCFSEQPARNVFMATGSSLLLGSFRQPRHTSPKSPVGGNGQTGVSIPLVIDEKPMRERRGRNMAQHCKSP